MALGNILWLLIIGGLFYFMMKKGGGCCGSHDHGGHDHENAGHGSENHAQKTHLEHHHKPEHENAVGMDAKDPVCGMTVEEKRSLDSEYLGHSYHFCSEQCKKLFDLNPGKYIHLLQG